MRPTVAKMRQFGPLARVRFALFGWMATTYNAAARRAMKLASAALTFPRFVGAPQAELSRLREEVRRLTMERRFTKKRRPSPRSRHKVPLHPSRLLVIESAWLVHSIYHKRPTTMAKDKEKDEAAAPRTRTPDLTKDWESFLSKAWIQPNEFSDAVSRLLLSPNAVSQQYWLGLLQAAQSSSPKIADLVQELMQARENSLALAKTLVQAQHQSKDTAHEAEALRNALDEQYRKALLLHLSTRVSDAAKERLLNVPGFQKLFEDNIACDAVIVSIDIRHSTELMLRARDPQLFAAFVTTLCNGMRRIIIRHGGIFDKFTGDGILAFFPLFYSGEDAGYLAVKAAAECHQAFSEHYQASRQCFTSVLAEIGVGIGIDFGKVRIVQLSSDLTVVGTPVVYACRMSGAPFGQTYLNEPAYEMVVDRDSLYFDFQEAQLPFKHEGSMVAHKVTINGKLKAVDIPQWRIDAGLISSPYPESDFMASF